MGRIWAEIQDQVFLTLSQQVQFCSHSERCFDPWSRRIRRHATQIHPRLKKHIPHKDSFRTPGAGHFFKEIKINYGFSSSQIWELDHKERWMPKNLCFGIVWLEKIFENPLNCRKIQPVNLKGNQSCIFIGRADAEAPILWTPDVKSWLIGKILEAGKDRRWKEKGW